MTIDNIYNLLNSTHATYEGNYHSIQELSVLEYQAFTKHRDTLVDDLADLIYDYVSNKRVIQLDAYTSAINAVTGDFDTISANYIIAKLLKVFKEKFGKEISRRGESPELVDQIIKRTGKETKPQLEVALKRKSSIELAKNLQFIKYKSADQIEVLEVEISRYSNTQINELRYLFENLTCYQQAELAYDCISAENSIDYITLYILRALNSKRDYVDLMERFFINQTNQENLTLKDWIDHLDQPEDTKEKLNFIFFTEQTPPQIEHIVDNLDLYWETFVESYQVDYLDTQSTCFNDLDREMLGYPFIAAEVCLESEGSSANNISKPEILDFIWQENSYSAFNKFEKSIFQFSKLEEQEPISLLDYIGSNLRTKKSLINFEITQKKRLSFAALFPFFILDQAEIEQLIIIHGFSSCADLRSYLSKELGFNADANLIRLSLIAKTQKLQIADVKELKIINSSEILEKIALDLQSSNFDEVIQLIGALTSEQINNIIFDLLFKQRIDFLQIVSAQFNPVQTLQIEAILSGLNFHADNKNFIPYSPVQIAVAKKLLSNLELDSISDCYQNASILRFELFEKESAGHLLNNFSKLLSKEQSVEDLEFGYNLLFSFWERSQEYSHGVFRSAIQKIRNEEKISTEKLDQLVSLAEGFPETLVSGIRGIVTSEQADLNKVLKLKEIFREHRIFLPIIIKLYKQLTKGYSIRREIHGFKLRVRDENITMLMLDGYDPEYIAVQINQFIQTQSTKELTELLLDIFIEENKSLIPQDQNWRQEYFHQIRIRYEEKYNNSVLSDLISGGIGFEGEVNITQIARVLYGQMATRTHTLYRLIKKADLETLIKAIQKYQNYYKPAEIERINHLYQAYYGEDLYEDIKLRVDDEGILELLKRTIDNAVDWENIKLKNS